MIKISPLHLLIFMGVFLLVSEAKQQPQLTSTGANGLRTPQSTGSKDSSGVDTTNDRTRNRAFGGKISVAKSILNMILSTICGEGHVFNLKKRKCESFSLVVVHAFGNPGLGK